MARDMLMSLAHVLRGRINTALRTASAFALMVDESTDVSTANSMVLYVRFVYERRSDDGALGAGSSHQGGC